MPQQEVELKLKIEEDFHHDIAVELTRILGISEFTETNLVNIYYDTLEMKLHKSNVALRVREDNGVFIQTLKTRGSSINGFHQRSEWEWEIESPKLNSRILSNCNAWPPGIKVHHLLPIFQTNFARKKTVLEWKGTTIELVIDRGYVISKEREQKIYEIELEFIDGETSDLLELGEKIQRSLPASPSNISKAERGYELFMLTA